MRTWRHLRCSINGLPLSVLLGISVLVAGVFPGSVRGNEGEPPQESYYDLSLEELSSVVVTSTSFFDQSLTRSPGAVQILAEERLNHSPAQTLNDLFQSYISGVHMGATENSGPSFNNRGIAKTTNTTTLVLLDGQGLNQRNFFGYNAGLVLPLLGDFRQVEVMNGPGAIVHGSGALNGFVNLIPKNGTDNPGAFVRSDYGFKEQLKKLEAGYGLSYGNQRDLFVYAGVAEAKGFSIDNNFNADQAPGFETNTSLLKNMQVGGLPRPSYKFAAYWNHDYLSVQGLFQSVDFHPNTFIGRFDQDASWHQTIFALRPKLRVPLTTTETIEVIPSLELFDYGIENRTTKPFLGGTPAADAGGSESHLELKSIFTSQFFEAHEFAFGGLFGRRTFNDRNQFFSGKPAESYFAAMDSRWDEYAVFAEDIIHVGHDLTLTLGLRYDRVDYSPMTSTFLKNSGVTESLILSDQDHITPRIAMAYEVMPTLHVKVSYQEGFHYPDAAQFLEWGLFNHELALLNQPLLPQPIPETLKSLELNILAEIPSANLSLGLNAYYNVFEDILLFHNLRNATDRYSQATIDAIVANQFFFGAAQNASADYKSIGGETSLTWTPMKGLTTTLTYSISKPIDVDRRTDNILQLADSDGEEWLRYPTHQVKWWFDFLYESWRFHWNVVAESSPDAKALDPNFRGNDDPYVRVNALLGYNVTRQFTIQLSVKNLYANSAPPVSFVNNRPFNGNLGTDERLVYLGVQWNDLPTSY